MGIVDQKDHYDPNIEAKKAHVHDVQTYSFAST